MIVNKYKYGGGGSGSGVTPQEVQAQIDSALTPYWDSAATESAITEALSGISLDGYYTSAQTDEKIASAVTPVSEHLFDVEQVTASALTELHDGLLEVSARTVDMSGYYTSAQTNAAISAATSGKADAATNPGIYSARAFPKWNAQGIITGITGDTVENVNFSINGRDYPRFKESGDDDFPPIYAPTTSGNPGEILVSTGSGAPVWSAVTGSDMSGYWNSAETKSYVDSAATNLQDQLDIIDNTIPAAILDLNQKKVESQDVKYMVKLTQSDYDQLVLDDDVDPDTFYIIVNSI